jgi:hypothetical protein
MVAFAPDTPAAWQKTDGLRASRMGGLNRAQAAWELFKQDDVTVPGDPSVVDDIATVGVKAYDGVSGLLPALLTPINKNSYEVVPRTGPVTNTIQSVRSMFMARWFGKGNPLNLIPKVVSAFTEVPDGLIQDGLHLFGRGSGYVVRTVD